MVAGAEGDADELRRPHLITVDGEVVHAGHPDPDDNVVYIAQHAQAEPRVSSSLQRVFGEDVDDAEDLIRSSRARRSHPDALSHLAIAAVFVLYVGALGWFAAATQRAAGGAEAGAFILLGSVLLCWYLARPDDLQHASVAQAYRRWASFVDLRVDPFRQRTELGLKLRREREAALAVRNERARRIGELGEAAYRLFRAGKLDPVLTQHAERISLIERHMLVQDGKVTELLEQRAAVGSEGHGQDGQGHDEPTAPR